MRVRLAQAVMVALVARPREMPSSPASAEQ